MDAKSLRLFKHGWNLHSENEACEHYASIAYVARVRTQNGTVLRADNVLVIEEARKFSSKFDDRGLEPEK